MKLLKVLLGGTLFYVLMIGGGSQLSSCKKTVIEHDTTTIVKIDTLIKTDTVTIIDSLSELRSGLVAYYNFNGGNLNDSSGNGNNITLNNNATKTADRYGRANNAYLFDGSSSYMTVANSASINPSTAITLMATVKINGFYSANCVSNQIFGKGWNDFINGFYELRFSSSVGCGNAVDTSKEQFNAAYGDLNSRTGGGSPDYIHTNNWYTVVYTYANGVGNIYVNGVLKNTFIQTLGFTPNTQELFIGKHGDPQYPYYFNGVIDEIRIYNKALCAEDVTQLYNLKQ